MPTASNAHFVITPTGQLARGKQVDTYRYKLLAERLLKERMPGAPQTAAMRHGIETEPSAVERVREWLEVEYPMEFCTTNDERVGATPDFRVVGSPEIGEVKCPEVWTHIGYLVDGLKEEKYKPQLQCQLWVCDMQRTHFISYHAQCPLLHIIVERDQRFINVMAKAMSDFCNQLDEMEHKARMLGDFIPREIIAEIEATDWEEE